MSSGRSRLASQPREDELFSKPPQVEVDAGAPTRLPAIGWPADSDLPHRQATAANGAWDRINRLQRFGMPSAVFHGGDGTGAREALRVWHQLTVMPLARILSYELTERLETDIKLVFDPYARDQVSRAQVASKLAAIDGMTAETALQIAGIMSNAS